MSLARVKTWSSGEVLTASDLNAEYNNILNNARDLISPLTGSLDMNGLELIMDGDADSSLTADTDDKFDLRLGGVDLFIWDGTAASLVNGFTWTGAATGVRPRMAPTGSDTNIGIALRPKGTGAGASVILEDGNGNEVLIGGVATAAAVNEVTVTNAATGNPPSIAATGGDSNINVKIVPKGTGTVNDALGPIMPVGVALPYLGSTAPTGWVLGFGTIGSATSGATNRANADTEALYTLLWNSMADAEAPVATGRGANAAADFAANKAIGGLDSRGYAFFGKDDMGGSAANRITNAGSSIVGTTLGVAGGAQNRTIGTTNLPASGLSIPSLSVSATGTIAVDTWTGGGTTVQLIKTASDGAGPSGTSTGTASVSGSTGTGTTGNMGSGNALATMNPARIVNIIIKL